MYKIYLPVILSIILLLSAVSGYAQEKKQGESFESLVSAVSTDDATINAEAASLGIPEAQTKRYVTRMRNLNKQYMQGFLTRTEYIAAKKQLIEDLQ
jgi:hypothetical protein